MKVSDFIHFNLMGVCIEQIVETVFQRGDCINRNVQIHAYFNEAI